MINKFKNELEEFLHTKSGSTFDLLPLVQKYTSGNSQDEINSFRTTIMRLISDYKKNDLIKARDEDIAQLLHIPPTHRPYIEEPIIICSTFKFEDYYNKKNTPTLPVVYNTFTTHGDNSPIAGRDVSFKESGNTNPVDSKSLDVAKKGLNVNIIGIIIATILTIIGILSAKHII